MPTRKSALTPQIYQLKVTLLGTSPPIWRRLLVPADMTLAHCATCCKPRWGGRTATCTNFPLASGALGDPILKTGLWGCPLRKTNARCISPAYWKGSAPRLFYTYDFGDSWEHSMVLEKRLQLIRTRPIRSARMVNSRVHRKIVEAFPDSMIWSRPSTTPTTTGAKKCSTGSAKILIPKPSRLTTSTRCSRLRVGTDAKRHSVRCRQSRMGLSETET
jgi:hypothetical protein